jgi:hypothetical protein
VIESPPAARAYVLGGNASTLAFVSSLVPEKGQVTAWLVPLAWTPIGCVTGDAWQRVNIAADNIGGWVDQTFAPDDDRAFVTSLRELDLLARVGWSGATPTELRDEAVVNPDDLPEDVLEALSHPAEALAQCSVCRRTCVRGHFVWQERQLCAWDYHAGVFGKRGPWQDKPYEERFFETLPQARYVAAGLLEENGVDAILAVDGVDETLARRVVLDVMASDPGPHLAVRTGGGLTLLRERSAGAPRSGAAN